MQFDNLSDAALADEIGTLDRLAKALKERLDAAKAERQRSVAPAAARRHRSVNSRLGQACPNASWFLSMGDARAHRSMEAR